MIDTRVMALLNLARLGALSDQVSRHDTLRHIYYLYNLYFTYIHILSTHVRLAVYQEDSLNRVHSYSNAKMQKVKAKPETKGTFQQSLVQIRLQDDRTPRCKMITFLKYLERTWSFVFLLRK